jgi:hypothetical protein
MSQKESQQTYVHGQYKRVETVTIDHKKKSSEMVSMSFEELCPQWSLALATGVSLNRSLDIKEGKRCIVGEAHGFNQKHVNGKIKLSWITYNVWKLLQILFVSSSYCR